MASRTTVFHGTISKHTISLAHGIDLTISDKYTDFGQGFYVTKDKHQAQRFASRLSKLYNDKEQKKQQRNAAYRPNSVRGIVFAYSLDTARLEKLRGYTFLSADDNWRKFVYNNRIDHSEYLLCDAGYNQQTPPNYQYVTGPLADGSMSDLELVKAGLIKVAQFLDGIVPIGDQIALHTNEAVNCIKGIGVSLC